MVDEIFRVVASMPTLGVLTLTVVGDLDAATAHHLTEELGEWLGIDELIIDLHDCRFIDSHGLRALLDCRLGIGSQASMRVFGAPADVAATVRLAGLDTLLGLEPPS